MASHARHFARLRRAAGLVPQDWYASFTLRPLTFDARRLLVVAAKTAT